MSAQQQGSSGGAGGDGGRMPRDMKDLLKICAEMTTTNRDETESDIHSFERMSPEVIILLIQINKKYIKMRGSLRSVVA